MEPNVSSSSLSRREFLEGLQRMPVLEGKPHELFRKPHTLQGALEAAP